MSDYVKKTSIEGLLVLERPVFEDERGFFKEVFHKDEIEKLAEIEFNAVQMNHSRSKPGVLRGLHAEKWNKIVYPMTGEAFVAIVDIRPDSPSFGKFEAFELGEKNRIGLFIPNGLANSLCVTSETELNYLYLVDAYYDGSDTRAIAWNDPDINIPWPIKDPIISDRDKNNPTLREMFPEKF